MITPTHRIRVEEKKLYRRLFSTILFLVIALIFLISTGLPLLAKVIVTFSSLRKEKPVKNNISVSLLLPPILESTLEATNSAKITIAGFAQREATVKIFLNDREKVKVLADNEGKFKANNIILTEGTNIITAQTIQDREESSLSASLTIIYKKTSPQLDISTPSEGQKFSETTNEITISGETEAGSRITINDRLVIVDPAGKFNYTVKLADGENTFKIVAFDLAGNQTTIERKVTFTK